MKGGESLGNEEGSEETSEEDCEEEVSPTRIYTPGVRPLTSGVFLCPNAKWLDMATCSYATEPVWCEVRVVREPVRQREMERDEALREMGGIPMQEMNAPK